MSKITENLRCRQYQKSAIKIDRFPYRKSASILLVCDNTVHFRKLPEKHPLDIALKLSGNEVGCPHSGAKEHKYFRYREHGTCPNCGCCVRTSNTASKAKKEETKQQR